jgi:1-phosphofructokinase
MIYTVTFNPSLDYVVRVNEFELGNLHRTREEELYVGGKGINVSTVLKRLGAESIALGFVAGFTGDEILRRLQEMEVTTDFITLARGTSRINIELKTDNNMETKINGQGPEIDQSAMELLYEKLNRIKSGDFLVLSGSVPKGIPLGEDIYSDICRKMRNSGIRLVIDAEGFLLRNTLKEHPFLIKPNLYELEKLFGQALCTDEDILACAGRLQKEGALNVLVSMGREGAMLLDEHGTVHRLGTPEGKTVNTVGSGDAMIAGFLARLSQKAGSRNNTLFGPEDFSAALKLGVAAGSAGAFSNGLPEKTVIDEIFGRIGMSYNQRE